LGEGCLLLRGGKGMGKGRKGVEKKGREGGKEGTRPDPHHSEEIAAHWFW